MLETEYRANFDKAVGSSQLARRMKDITTVCSQEEVMVPGEVPVLSAPVLHQSAHLNQMMVSPLSSGYESCYNGHSPTTYSSGTSPTGTLIPSPSTSFHSPLSVSAAVMQSPSPSLTFSPSPPAAANFIPSPPASFTSSASANVMPSDSPSMTLTASRSPPASANFISSQTAPFTSLTSGRMMASPTGNMISSPETITSPAPSDHTNFMPSPSRSFTSEVSLNSPLSPTESVMSVKSEDCWRSSMATKENQQMPPRSLGAKRAMSPSMSACTIQVKQERSISPGMTVSGNLLPPCRICLDKASGFHYGLNTCEACKGFFRRSLKRGASYLCTRDKNCDVTGERRNLCGYCRYQKCIALGMSKKAIKTGRYTHAKRTRDTLEIKKLMGAENSSEMEEDIDFDTVIAQIIRAHDDYVISSTRVSDDYIRRRQQEKMEEIGLQQQLYGQMGVSSQQHKEFLDKTGLDIDDRQQIMDFHVRNSDRWIRGYISFAKHVPGFRTLTLTDQANLVKFARIEFWFLGSYHGYDSDLDLAVMPNGRCFTRQEMYSVWQREYIDCSFDLALQLKKLKVTPEEMILVKTICMTAGDRCTFEEPKKVEQIQWRMIRCLQHLLRQSHSDHAEFVSTFSRVFACLSSLRDLNEAEYKTIQNTQLYEKFNRYPLIMEVLPY